MFLNIKFLGATNGEVTGSRTLVTFAHGLKVLVDFGMMQSNDGAFSQTLAYNGREFEFDATEVDYLILTHAHNDHCGLTPLLIKRGFKGKIIATAPTGEFARISLPDTAKIMESDVRRANKIRPKNKLQTLFSIEEAEESIKHIQCYDYNTEIVLDDKVSLELKCAGHMLGASMPVFTYMENGKKKSVLFTGDTSGKTESKPFLPPADDIGEVNYIVSESTYGNRTHSKNDPMEVITRSIQETCIDRGKTLLIPTFSMQRSSELLWLLRESYMENNHFYKIPIYLDSPMAIKSQEVMDNNREYWGEKWIERDKELTNLFNWEVIEYISDYKDSMALANGHPKIILSSSGMCTAGRIMNHLVSFLSSKNCKILFTGYQAEGTLGRHILETERKSVSVNRKQVVIRAEIEKMDFSSHADMNQLVELLKTSKKGKLKKVFLIHGGDEEQKSLKSELDRHLKNVEVIIPEYNVEYNIK